jgi:hypothetical protein
VERREGSKVVIWPNIIVANIGWSDQYRDQAIHSSHTYVVDHGTGAEAFSFSPWEDGMFYGYIRDVGIHAEVHDKLWTVVFVSKPKESAPLRVVGWFERAIVGGYRERPEYEKDPDFPVLEDGLRHIYNTTTRNAHIVPVDDRQNLVLPKGHRLKSAGAYYVSGLDFPTDSEDQRAARNTMADWLRSVLPRRRDESRCARPPEVRPRSLPGVTIDDGGTPLGRSSVSESEEHVALRLWTCRNAEAVAGLARKTIAATETPLDSGDRVDVTFETNDTYWVVEVKSRNSPDSDHLRGIYQCVKYRAVAAAMRRVPTESVRALLVTERPLSDEHKSLVGEFGIAHFQAPLDHD